MAVVASYTYEPDVLIPPSQVINFTDTSEGSPNRWLWEFGDGEVSNDQHPSHTFTGEAPTEFTVKLTVWIESSITSISMPSPSGSALCTFKSAIGTDPATVASTFNAASFSTFSATRKYVVNMVDTNASDSWREFRAARVQWKQTPTSNEFEIPMIRIPLIEGDPFFNRYPRGLKGTIVIKRSGTTWGDPWTTVFSQSAAVGFPVTIDFPLTAYRGVASIFQVTSTELALPGDESDSQEQGFMGFSVQSYNMIVSGTDIDEDEQTLIFGTPPIADFTANPTQGTNPLNVQFVNETTLAVGLPTTYSWKKRITNSGDAFVEFSTAENPLEIFTK